MRGRNNTRRAGGGQRQRHSGTDEQQSSNDAHQEERDDGDASEALAEAEGRGLTGNDHSSHYSPPRTTNSSEADQVHTVDWADDIAKSKYKKRYNVAPRCYSPIIRRDPNNPAHYLLEGFQWGLTPHWAKEPPQSPQHTINATCEKVRERSSMWASMRDKKRCIVVAEGFYEWQATGHQKRAHFVKPKNGLMLMAGLWDIATFGGEFDELRTFTIITVPVSKQLRFLHNRMPAILENPEEVEAWLSDKPWDDQLSQLLRPYEDELTCYQVTPEVGNVRNDDPSFIVPLANKKGTIANMFAAQTSASSPSAKGQSDGASPKKDEHEEFQFSGASDSSSAKLKLKKDASEVKRESEAKRKASSAPDTEVLQLDSDDDDEGARAPPKKKNKTGAKVHTKSRTHVAPSKSPAGRKKGKLETDDNGNAMVTNFFKKEE
ncbi:hypothetical protein OIV83_003081 [Microbotryomycetes sp. JL201]|nr:hypothetical protein OIV83_003081 [Microbotryomycetes sp. JL201]